jgi:hypothetical protein
LVKVVQVVRERNNKQIQQREIQDGLWAFFRKKCSSTKLVEEKLSTVLDSIQLYSICVW